MRAALGETLLTLIIEINWIVDEAKWGKEANGLCGHYSCKNGYAVLMNLNEIPCCAKLCQMTSKGKCWYEN
jgi:hypothetical protein